MTDNTIKKVRLSSRSLPPVTFSTVYNPIKQREEIDDLFYLIRYRIVSNDRNRRSHWSPVSRVAVPDIPSGLPYTAADRVSIQKNGSHIDVIWSFPQSSELIPEDEARLKLNTVFDVWVRWNTNNTTNLEDSGWSEWEFETTVSGNTWSISPPESANYKSIDVAIQVPTLVKLRDYNSNKLTLFKANRDAL